MTEHQVLTSLFDANWYLARYPDVAAAGVEPLKHYLEFGMREGRWPCQLTPLDLEVQLWQSTAVIPLLDSLQRYALQDMPLLPGLAAWALARWHASWDRWDLALPWIDTMLADELALTVLEHQGPFLLAFSAYNHTGSHTKAAAVLADSRWPASVDKSLAQTMLLSGRDKITALADVFTRMGLSGLSCSNKPAPLFDTLQSKAVTSWWQRWRASVICAPFVSTPLVSVIVPCFNAAATLPCALNSLLAQSWRNLEVLVADDASTDNSVAVVKAFAAKDKRIKLVALTQNSGAYAARNLALQQAQGAFITCHDADDWSHPEKIARQVQALEQTSDAMASVSHWVRCDHNLQFQRWRAEDAWVHRNVSSLMFRCELKNTLGYWDLVSVNADTEYYYRIKQAYGASSIVEVMPGVPLAFGRVEPGSLSQHSSTHLRTQYCGVRKQYMDAALAWHQGASGTDLYLPAEPTQRAFVVPWQICRGPQELQLNNSKTLVERANGFDPHWYLSRYPDVASAGCDALEHYLLHGDAEGRDPSPLFSSSGYRYVAAVPLNQPALLSAIAADVNVSCAIEVPGDVPDADGPHLMLFAHAASGGQFGAERSFIDVLMALHGLGYRLTVVLPGGQNTDYVSNVRRYCQSVVFLPYSWWAYARPVQLDQVACLTQLIQQRQVSLVYVNTVVLYEPLLAARAAGVPSVMHVRELPQHDAGLCAALHASAQQVREHVLAHADGLIANSTVVANWLQQNDRCKVIANTVSLGPVSPIPSAWRLKVAMLSSNLAKKGLADFISLAQGAAQQQLPLDFYLFGPDSADLQQVVASGELPDNVRLCGYVASAEQALAQVDVVLNLSHFQESFGRTVLEAMQAGRVVVAYDWGALPELVTPGHGFLVPFKDIAAVSAILLQLHNDRTLLQATAERAMQYARQNFSAAILQQSLQAYFKEVIK